MEFLAHKIVSNVRELEGALNRIAAQTQLIGRDITLETAQEAAARPAARQRAAGHDRRDPEAGGRALQHQDGRDDLEPAGPRRGAAAAGRDVPGKAADLALAARDRPQVRRPRPHHGHARGQEDRGADAPATARSPRMSSCCAACCRADASCENSQREPTRGLSVPAVPCYTAVSRLAGLLRPPAAASRGGAADGALPSGPPNSRAEP